MSTIRYQVLADQLRTSIRGGIYPVGQRLPGELSIAKSEQVSRQTVREALFVLADEGLVVSRKGSGWWVAQETQAAGRQNAVIGFVSQDDDPVNNLIREGMQSVMQAKGLSVRFIPSAKGDANVEDFVLPPGLAGLVFRSASMDSTVRRAANKCLLPTVAIHHQAHEQFDTVCADYTSGAEQLVDRAYQLGHRRMVFTAPRGLFSSASSFMARRDGYVRAMQRLRLQPLIQYTDYGIMGDRNPMQAQVRRFEEAARVLHGDPTCWFEGLNLTDAVNLVELMPSRWSGVSVCGFVNQAITDNAVKEHIPTAVVEPWLAVGRAAGARMLARLAVPFLEPTLTLVPTTMLIGTTLREACPEHATAAWQNLSV